jgi:hypothetical protein
LAIENFQLPNLITKSDQMFWLEKNNQSLDPLSFKQLNFLEQLPKDFRARIKFSWNNNKNVLVDNYGD